MSAQPRELLAKDIGARVKARREELGYSMELVAGLATISKSTIIEIEMGRNVPRGDTLIALAFVLEVRVEDLLPTDYSPYVGSLDRFRGLIARAADPAAEQPKVSSPKGMPTDRYVEVAA